jgi:hypothetical protein
MNTTSYFNLSAVFPKRDDDVAEITLRLGENVISRIADIQQRTIRDYFRASSTSLALWLADNWWRLRWETIKDVHLPSVDWRLRHELNSASGGALWPPVTIYSVGERIAFVPSVGKYVVSGPQSYLDFKISMVAAGEYENELDRFFQVVLEHCATMEDGKALNSLLKQINIEREDQELAAWRRLEACLGFDPDSAPDEVIDALVKLEEVAGENGVEEAAHAVPGEAAAKSLQLAIEATRDSSVQVDLSLADEIEGDWCNNGHMTPWKMAEAAATELRTLIGIPKGPLGAKAFEDMFKSRWSDLRTASATARSLPYGTRIGAEKTARIALTTVGSKNRRFELVRQLGDAVWSKDTEFGIVSRSKTDRQKFQRAFANSLLCPFDDLQRELDVGNPTDEAMRSAARVFEVHESVVRNQLAYKGYIQFERTDDEAEVA